MSNTNFSSYKKIFCDSAEALRWAYKRGLPNDTIIFTSSPALLLDDNPYIRNIESRWTIKELKIFQSTIKEFTEDIFDAVSSIEGVSHELALCLTQSALFFHNFLYKASCLIEQDLVESRLFIRINVENSDPLQNNMNSPWDYLISSNSKFDTVDYLLRNDEWGKLTTKGVPWLRRMQIIGIETLFYRLVNLFTGWIPANLFRKQVLIHSENEVVIETAAVLALRGVRIKKLRLNKGSDIVSKDSKLLAIQSVIQPIVLKRIKEWVTPQLVQQCENIFFQRFEKQLSIFQNSQKQWKSILEKEVRQRKTVLLTNWPGKAERLAMIKLCHDMEIPVVSAQHGVTMEISAVHSAVSASYEINSSDCFIAYNRTSAEVANSSHFCWEKGKVFVSGMSARHFRMVKSTPLSKVDVPIVYISTNLYTANLGFIGAWMTDYDRAKAEYRLINDVFARLPHNVCYKTYPEENRRYADRDPVIEKVLKTENIKLFDQKIDMRFLLGNYRILITSSATSTLSWPIMTGKPVVFINMENNKPLTEKAHDSLAKGIFLFDTSDPEFHEELLIFLSQPIEKIEELWKKKKEDRTIMIKDYFTEYDSGAGMRSANIIIEEYLN